MSDKISKIKAENNDGWETIIDFTEIHKNGISGREILQRLHMIEN